MALGKISSLGVMNGKQYFWDERPEITDQNKKIPNPTFRKLVWRIPDIRAAIHAESGHKILSADYSQIEVRLMAFLSQDPWLIQAINSGKDIHCYMAVDTFGEEMAFDYDTINVARKNEEHVRFDELSKVRNDIKAVVFGTPYGAGPPRIAFITGKTVEQAAALINRYFEKASVLKEWLDNAGRDALRYGFSTSPRGRKRFYVMPHQDDPDREEILGQIRRYAGNHPIQAGNVDMLKPAMKMIYDELRARKWSYSDARILFVVHDEIVMTSRIELVPEVEIIMKTCMQKAYSDIIPDIVNKIDVGIDDNWKKN
jgi:DNA polymerase-1